MDNLTWVEISKENIAYNLKNLRSLLRARVRLMAVVKSNAYGHGLVEFAKEAVKNKVDYLGVVTIDEALALREAGIIKPILVLGYVPSSRIEEAVKKQIEVPIISPEYAIELIRNKFVGKLKVHLKIETGINRLGIKQNSILSTYKELSRNKKFEVVGMYSHLASVEENNMEYTKSQLDKFEQIIDVLNKNNITFNTKHIGASGAALILPESHFDMVRVGISCYGLWPSKENEKSFWQEADIDTPKPFLKPVLSYKTRIVQIKEVNEGYIGYGCTYRVTRPMKLAVLPVGYYEGFDRGLSGTKDKPGGEVLINGQKCPVVGRVCMNMTIVDVSMVSSKLLNVGDEAVIIGKQKSNEITTDEIAEKIGSINYEVVSRIPAHIPRIMV